MTLYGDIFSEKNFNIYIAFVQKFELFKERGRIEYTIYLTP